jgi:hypothetical protein
MKIKEITFKEGMDPINKYRLLNLYLENNFEDITFKEIVEITVSIKTTTNGIMDVEVKNPEFGYMIHIICAAGVGPAIFFRKGTIITEIEDKFYQMKCW